MSAPAAVLFDLDGTLVDSRPGIVAALNATLRELGEPEQPEAALVGRIGPPIHDTWAELLRRPADAVDDVVAAYRARYGRTMLEGTTVYPGVVRLLERLRAEGHPMAVATSKAQPIAVVLLKHLGLDGFFAAVRGPVPPSTEEKPATVGRALQALGPSTGVDAVLVGDRHHDVAGGHAHGLRVIGAAWGYGTVEELRAAGAAAIAAEPAGVVALLRGARGAQG
jgi:phosphoglycolate phosphatase